MKNIVKIISTAIILLCLAANGVSADDHKIHFEDIKGHWAQESIETLSERGVINGMEDGLFHPEETVTNAQLVTMLLKTKYSEIHPVDANWYSGYMDFAQKNGIIEDSEIEFPNEPVTRQSTARIVHETLRKVYNEPDESEWQAADALADLYSCHTCVMHLAQVYVKGIMTGKGDGLFHSSDTLTRAEAASIIMRLIEPDMRTVPQTVENSVNLISASDALAMMENGAVLVDVRPADEYEKGHIQGSISIPIESIVENPLAAFDGIGIDDVVIVYCRRGTNSRRAALILEGMGYSNVFNLGGIENGLITEMHYEAG